MNNSLAHQRIPEKLYSGIVSRWLRSKFNIAFMYGLGDSTVSNVMPELSVSIYSGMTLREVKGQPGAYAKAWQSGCLRCD